MLPIHSDVLKESVMAQSEVSFLPIKRKYCGGVPNAIMQGEYPIGRAQSGTTQKNPEILNSHTKGI